MIPLFLVGYITAPFALFAHIRLPPFARVSDVALRSYVKKLPVSTDLSITTMSHIAKPRVSFVKIADLEPVRYRLGIVNYVRDTGPENATRKWYNFPAVGSFSMQGNAKPRVPWVWDQITPMIAKNKR